MKLTIAVKIVTTDEQAEALRETLDRRRALEEEEIIMLLSALIAAGVFDR